MIVINKMTIQLVGCGDRSLIAVKILTGGSEWSGLSLGLESLTLIILEKMQARLARNRASITSKQE